MIVTGLVRKGNKVKIFFDDESFITVSYEIAMESGLRKNDSFTEEEKNSVIRKNELFEIKNSAFRFLSRRIHSRYEVRLKLVQKKFDKRLIDEVLDYLQNKNYLNDTEFAEKFALEKITLNKIGVHKLKGELLKKGVDRDIIDSILVKFEDDPQVMENAEKLAEKKLRQLSRKGINSLQKKQKLYQYLRSKGFQGEIISQIIDKIDLASDGL